MRRPIAAALLAAGLLSGCIVRYLRGPQLTGTCDGACDHYLRCRGGDGATKHRDDAHPAEAPARGAIGGVREACLAECPEVFGDRDSVMAFESLSCEDTVEYVEGADRRPLGGGADAAGAAAAER